MIIECSTCHARYQYDEARFEGKASKKIRCAKCSSVFEIHHPAAAKAESAPAAPPRLAPAEGTQTRVARPKAAEPAESEDEETPAAAESSPLAMPAGRRLSLAIIDGANAGTVHRITKPRITVGRSGADIVIEDDEASRQHASLEIRDAVYVLRDLDSRNGTLVDGSKITGPVELQDKSEFVIGGTTLMLIVTQEA